MSDPTSPLDSAEILSEQATLAVSHAIQESLESNIPIVYSSAGKIFREYQGGRIEECAVSDEDLAACLPALRPDIDNVVSLAPAKPGRRILRIFAGPNGSGKSTIYDFIAKRYESGPFINADRIQDRLERSSEFSLAELGLSVREADVRCAIQESSWSDDELGAAVIASMTVRGPVISVPTERGAYSAAIIADVARNMMLQAGLHFSLETVMSHKSKLKFMREAIDLGYSCYLYYICTDSPLVNIERVRSRVLQGGHDVPRENIVARYYRSLSLLKSAIRLSFRAFVFDNSAKLTGRDVGGTGQLLCLEFKNGEVIHRFRRQLPTWVVESAAR